MGAATRFDQRGAPEQRISACGSRRIESSTKKSQLPPPETYQAHGCFTEARRHAVELVKRLFPKSGIDDRLP